MLTQVLPKREVIRIIHPVLQEAREKLLDVRN
jgi:hypothetical protein